MTDSLFTTAKRAKRQRNALSASGSVLVTCGKPGHKAGSCDRLVPSQHRKDTNELKALKAFKVPVPAQEQRGAAADQLYADLLAKAERDVELFNASQNHRRNKMVGAMLGKSKTHSAKAGKLWMPKRRGASSWQDIKGGRVTARNVKALQCAKNQIKKKRREHRRELKEAAAAADPPLAVTDEERECLRQSEDVLKIKMHYETVMKQLKCLRQSEDALKSKVRDEKVMKQLDGMMITFDTIDEMVSHVAKQRSLAPYLDAWRRDRERAVVAPPDEDVFRELAAERYPLATDARDCPDVVTCRKLLNGCPGRKGNFLSKILRPNHQRWCEQLNARRAPVGASGLPGVSCDSDGAGPAKDGRMHVRNAHVVYRRFGRDNPGQGVPVSCARGARRPHAAVRGGPFTPLHISGVPHAKHPDAPFTTRSFLPANFDKLARKQVERTEHEMRVSANRFYSDAYDPSSVPSEDKDDILVEDSEDDVRIMF